MLNNLSIELLKAKRTKSFLISILVMGVGFAWAIAAATRYLSNPDMHQISLIFYMIKEVNGLILSLYRELSRTRRRATLSNCFWQMVKMYGISF